MATGLPPKKHGATSKDFMEKLKGASGDVRAELNVMRARRRAIQDATDAERDSEMRLNYGLAGTIASDGDVIR